MAEQLTTKEQRRILEVIRDAVADRGYPHRSVRSACSRPLTSTSSVIPSSRRSGARATSAGTRPSRAPSRSTSRNRWRRCRGRCHHLHAPDRPPVAAESRHRGEDVVEELLPLPRELVGQGQLFMLQVGEDSIVGAEVLDRDFVVVRRQDLADNGDMVAALLNDESRPRSSTSPAGTYVQLLPSNPAFDPIDGDRAQILGKVTSRCSAASASGTRPGARSAGLGVVRLTVTAESRMSPNGVVGRSADCLQWRRSWSRGNGSSRPTIPPGQGPVARLSPQLRFTSAPILPRRRRSAPSARRRSATWRPRRGSPRR